MDFPTDIINDHREVISRNTHFLLFSNDYKKIYDAVHALHDVFGTVTGIRAGNITDEDIFLPQGKAVSPIKAAHCLLELERTRRFLRGIYKAILQLKDKIKDRPINILYAGCGPYSTLLTPLTSMFGPDEIRFSLLDVNEISLNASRKLYEYLDLTKFVKEYILTDATTYQLKVEDNIDMIISETMLNALSKEPMVAIMNNLMPQLGPNGIFIPEQITVDAALLSNSEEMARADDYQPKRIMLGNVYTIGTSVIKSAPVTFRVKAVEKHRLLYLLTEIKVFNDEKLIDYNCSLNMPFLIAAIEQPQNFNAVTFTYEQGANPHFKHEFLNL